MSGTRRHLGYSVQLFGSQSLLFYSLNFYCASVFTKSVVHKHRVQKVLLHDCEAFHWIDYCSLHLLLIVISTKKPWKLLASCLLHAACTEDSSLALKIVELL